MTYLLRITLIALALLTTVSCTSKRMLTPDRTLHASIHSDRAQMQQAIVKALVGRGWTVQEITPQRVQAQITVREQYHAIAVARRVQHPCVAVLTRAAPRAAARP